MPFSSQGKIGVFGENARKQEIYLRTKWVPWNMLVYKMVKYGAI